MVVFLTWSFKRSVDWLIDWITVPWFDWLIDWLIDLFISSLIGRLIDWLTAGVVTAVVGFCGTITEADLRPNPTEVEQIFLCSIAYLCEPRNNGSTSFRSRLSMPVFKTGKELDWRLIWGMTGITVEVVLRCLVPEAYPHRRLSAAPFIRRWKNLLKANFFCRTQALYHRGAFVRTTSMTTDNIFTSIQKRELVLHKSIQKGPRVCLNFIVDKKKNWIEKIR